MRPVRHLSVFAALGLTLPLIPVRFVPFVRERE